MHINIRTLTSEESRMEAKRNLGNEDYIWSAGVEDGWRGGVIIDCLISGHVVGAAVNIRVGC